MKHGRHYANSRAREINKLMKDTRPAQRASVHAQQLAGVTIDCGYGTVMTNTMAQAGISTRGVREAFQPKGPGGRW